jgi:addiction module HigA family antidote
MAANPNEPVVHPGTHIKQSVLPPKLSVKKAAEMLGVGRPALSNLLNGNASLSPEMALRLEKAFGAKREALLQMQAAYDELQTREHEKEIAVRAYAPSFMEITATQIAAWSDQIATRSLLPAFLRRLVSTTGTNLTKIDFPAYDNAQRHGWDGQVETDTATPWIPSGISGWEFGCDKEPRQKAESDYAARTASIPVDERKNITFIFVTPRNWPGKDEWANTKRAEKAWKEVKALDASDLEQWLEQSVPAQGWMAERLGIASDGILSLEECWDRWAKVTKPELSKELFRGSIDAHKSHLETWLKQPPTLPFVVTADSQEEALAFLSCAFEAVGTPAGEFQDRAVALQTVAAFKKTTRASSRFIPIIASPEVEAVSAGLHKTQHTIIVRRPNAIEGEPNIALDLLDDKTFKSALIAMGIDEIDIPRYERESGQSPTILRRRLSLVPEIKFPPWAQDKALARKLIPLGFAGVWNSSVEADKEILSRLTKDSYQGVEESIVTLLHSDQTPVWSVGKYRGVASKIDVLYATHRLVTFQDLKEFFTAAQCVLPEKDPALDLPEEDRWAANLYGKTRNHSSALRLAICETLVLFAVHGNGLFKERLGFDVEAHVNKLIRELLTPLNAETWESQQHDLPRYAEAAPQQFLDILENDLKSDDPQIYALLRPADTGGFGGCPRSGLLWALETLAWKPERLLHVACILAKLSEHKINDNWGNTPERSLASIFRSWMPQTAATVDHRIAALEKLTERFPKIGWRLCVEQFDLHPAIGLYSSRPHWRNDASGAGQVVSNAERYQFTRKALDIALAWPSHDEHTLGDLVERLQAMPDEDQDKVWTLIKTWIGSAPDEGRKASLRERIRRNAFTRRGRKLGSKTRNHAKDAYDLLEASDPLVRHHWLFAKQWVDESFDELEDDKFDYHKREQKINKLRSDALKEIWSVAGYNGILRLCESGEASGVVGWHLADGIIREGEAIDFLYGLVSEPPDRMPARIDSCVSGFLNKFQDEVRDSFLSTLIERFSNEGQRGDERKVRLLRCAAFRKETWRHVDKLSKELNTRYWKDVYPYWARQDREELHLVIDRLLEVERPRAAFSVAHLDLKAIETKSLVRLLTEMATCDAEPAEHYRLSPYDISESLKVLDGRSDVSRDDLARLEFMYLTALDHSEHGIPNLERQLSETPALFMQAVGLTYKRKDDGQDPPEWRSHNSDEGSSAANQTWRLLHKAKRIPGTRDDGTIDVDKLKSWIKEVRALCKTHAREVVGDHSIGELLAKSPVGPDGIWPCEPVRQALEETGTKDIADGMAIGVYNARGAHWRGEGGTQERELAAKYRGWSKEVAFESPFVSQLLEQIAHGYDRDAEWHDTDSNVRKRITY